MELKGRQRENERAEADREERKTGKRIKDRVEEFQTGTPA